MSTPFLHSRRVHYISGFDPRGARHYFDLYRAEAQKQSQVNHASLHVGKRSRRSASVSAWEVRADWQGHSVHTDYEFLGWDDLVREHWSKSLWKTVLGSLPLYLHHTFGGGYLRAHALSRNAFFTTTLPLTYLLLLGAMVALGAWGGSLLPEVAGKIAATLGALGLGWAGLRLAKTLGFVWMLRTYAFIYRWSRGRVPGLESRIETLAEHILRMHRETPKEETLLVGHSVGAMVAVCVAARLVEKTRDADGHSALTGFHLLTLGQCLPLMSFFRHADHFRAQLQILASATHLPWTDISARADPLCLFQTDPLRASKIPCPAPNRIRLRAARIFRMFRKETYAKLRWNKIRMHFQYLMANELPTRYDYFEITAGPRSLRDLEMEGE